MSHFPSQLTLVLLVANLTNTKNDAKNLNNDCNTCIKVGYFGKEVCNRTACSLTLTLLVANLVSTKLCEKRLK